MMTFDELLEQIIALLQRDGRVTYRALKRCFGLEDDYLADLCGEIVKAKRLAVDEDGEVLVWVRAVPVSSSTPQEESSKFKVQSQDSGLRTPAAGLLRISLTVSAPCEFGVECTGFNLPKL